MKNIFFKFPFHFDETKLAEDLSKCLKIQWPEHFNQQDFEGSWTSIALRSASGRESDISAHYTEQAYINTPVLQECHYFREIIESFQCEKEAVRLLSLAAGSVIKEHTDPHAGYEFGFFRIHIPIQTVPDVSFKVDGYELPMKSGECWYADFHLPHSVENRSKTNRVHLIMDCKRNEWSDVLFGNAGYDFEEERKKNEIPLETKLQMIEELSGIDTEGARNLITQLKKEIAQTT